MKAIETTATLTEHGQLTLDEPLTLAHNSRVRIIVLVSEETENLDEPHTKLPSSEHSSDRQALLEAIDRVEARQDLVTFTPEEWHAKHHV